MATKKVFVAGFGGQGVLLIGQMLAYAAMYEGKEATWMPSYGPEMRGGTASCNVIISDEPVGSPIVSKPDILIAMNLPSLDRYEDSVAKGGCIFVDSSLIDRKVKRDDVKTYYIPATKLASDNSMPTLANMIIMGKLLKETGDFSDDMALKALNKVISAKHADMLDINLKALKIGSEN